MPATGAIARTAVNVRSGAQTRLSTLVHAVVLLLVVYFGTGLVSRIPLAALAGVLMVTAFRMAERHNLLAVMRSTRSDAIILLLTAFCTVTFDLIVAVEAGIVAAALLALRQIAKASEAASEPLGSHVELTPADEQLLLHEHIAVYRLDGALFFGAAQNFLKILTETADIKVVILRMSQIRVLDATGAKALGLIIQSLEESGVAVILKGLKPQHQSVLDAVGSLKTLRHKNYLVHSMPEAVDLARAIIAPGDAGHGAPLNQLANPANQS
jgi:SulP family sulfate permease